MSPNFLDTSTPLFYFPFLRLCLSPFSLSLSYLLPTLLQSPLLFFSISHFISHSVPHSMLGVCTGSSKNDNCDCTQFIPKKPKKTRCKACGHRRVAHSNPQSAPSTPSDDAAGSVAKPPTKATVNTVNYGGRVLESYGASTAHQTARKEMLSGYRIPSDKVCIVCFAFHLLTHRSPPAYEGKGKGYYLISNPLSEQKHRTGKDWQGCVFPLWRPGIARLRSGYLQY